MKINRSTYRPEPIPQPSIADGLTEVVILVTEAVADMGAAVTRATRDMLATLDALDQEETTP